MKRTLKRELKVLEIAKREALETSHHRRIKRLSPFVGCVRSWKLCVCSRRRGGGFPDAACVKIHSACVGEGMEEGRRHPPLKPLYSTMRWMEEVAMVRRLRLGPASLHS